MSNVRVCQIGLQLKIPNIPTLNDYTLKANSNKITAHKVSYPVFLLLKSHFANMQKES